MLFQLFVILKLGLAEICETAKKTSDEDVLLNYKKSTKHKLKIWKDFEQRNFKLNVMTAN